MIVSSSTRNSANFWPFKVKPTGCPDVPSPPSACNGGFLLVGVKVEIQNLTLFPQLNGKTGTVTNYAANGRINVTLDAPYTPIRVPPLQRAKVKPTGCPTPYRGGCCDEDEKANKHSPRRCGKGIVRVSWRNSDSSDYEKKTKTLSCDQAKKKKLEEKWIGLGRNRRFRKLYGKERWRKHSGGGEITGKPDLCEDAMRRRKNREEMKLHCRQTCGWCDRNHPIWSRKD